MEINEFVERVMSRIEERVKELRCNDLNCVGVFYKEVEKDFPGLDFSAFSTALRAFAADHTFITFGKGGAVLRELRQKTKIIWDLRKVSEFVRGCQPNPPTVIRVAHLRVQ